MAMKYFHRVTSESPTRFWVNNPTELDAELALAASLVVDRVSQRVMRLFMPLYRGLERHLGF